MQKDNRTKQEHSMNIDHGMMKQLTKLGLLLMMGVNMSADAGFLGFGGTNWKEEVLLHDGSKLIVERSVDRGGRHEIGQQPPIKEESMSFTLPATNERITWKSGFSADIGLADFQPLLLDIFQGMAYVVTSPVGCLAYNKWGRPNPPYVIFKYQDKAWNRITIQELPAELNRPNLIFSSPDNEVEKLGKNYITVAMVQQANNDLTQTQFKTILREASLPNYLCPQYSSGPKAPIPIAPKDLQK
jgi:hypothetical protein